jgi:hypothetical protein
MSYLSKILMVVLVVLMAMVSGCANYQFGDASKLYCAATTSETRNTIKDTMKKNGVSIGVDYCFSVGLIDKYLGYR